MPIDHLTKSQDWKQPRVQRVEMVYKKSPKKPFKLKKIVKLIAILGAFGCVVVFFILLGALAWVSRDLPSSTGVINRSLTVSTKIYDRKGETVLYDIHGDIKRTLITLNEIPNFTQKATLAAEDRDFYKHKGFSVTGIIRSIYKNITTGSRVGGSTLTQQFVKNAILTNEKTYTRKLKEFLLSFQVERKFSKDEILQMYFNEIPYGSVIYGVEAASQSFFGKPAKDLTLAESAILAAIPQAPTFYSPYGNNRDRLIVRQRYILDSMADLGYVTKEQVESAKAEKIEFKPLNESILAPHFVMYVRELLSEQYGEDFITQEGLKVYTTLDLEKQKIAEEAVKIGVETNGKKYGFTNASLVAMDPKNGQIISMVGSVDYFNDEIDGQVNVSLRPRQPGSSFKPIVYTAAFTKGYTPNTITYDVVTNFDTTGSKPYEPKNYNLGESGPVTLRKALAGSLNIPAVKITYLTGVNTVLDLATKLGYTTLNDRDRFGLALVLGGGEVKLLEHVGAYSVLAQEGIKHPISAILKIEDKNGRVLYEYKDKKEQVLDAEITRQTTDILSDDSARSYVFGSGSKLTLPGRPVAAKTGTTNDYHDAWTLGYTPSLVAGVWVGNNDNKEMSRGADGSVIAAPIWNQFMREALKDTPIESFTKPQPITTGKGVLDGAIPGEEIVKINKYSGELANESTPQDEIQEVLVRDLRTILYYIDKDDPRGESLRNTESDPQYTNWQQAIDVWAKKQGYTTKASIINGGYINQEVEKDQIGISIINPKENELITSQNIEIITEINSKNQIKTVGYYINEKLIKEEDIINKTKLNLKNIPNGVVNLIIKVTDEFENTKSTSIPIEISL